MEQKPIIYQVFTRLFGNDGTANVPGAGLKTNGVGKFDNFTTEALQAIRNLGATHVWYTGVLQHATRTDYARYGVHRCHPATVKGQAGSPYAITDYYDVDPDLAREAPRRMDEFHQLIERTHRAGLKVLIDFVPNHVARQYRTLPTDADPEPLGFEDTDNVAFSPRNNFYYIPHTRLGGPRDWQAEAAAPYRECPAKATGNDRFDAAPCETDWYDTVKLNYGVDYQHGHAQHFRPVPSTWTKMYKILIYWASKGIDGFRCDMVEMVPVEFWAWAIPRVRRDYPKLLFVAEIYNPAAYTDYLFRGHFDYLYDKVGLYDTLRGVVTGARPASDITHCWQSLPSIGQRMLNFLENHDEQRIASDFFASDPRRALPALVVSACMGTNPFMLYMGQELGERGMDSEGFSGRDGRTTIFDYWALDTLRRWRNGGRYDGGRLTTDERNLQAYYRRVLTLCNAEPALQQGMFYDLMYVNHSNWRFNDHRQFAFIRKHDCTALLIIANFDYSPVTVDINLPAHAFSFLGIPQLEQVHSVDLLSGTQTDISFTPYRPTTVSLPAYGSAMLRVDF